jgi:hypothetical protein
MLNMIVDPSLVIRDNPIDFLLGLLLVIMSAHLHHVLMSGNMSRVNNGMLLSLLMTLNVVIFINGDIISR